MQYAWTLEIQFKTVYVCIFLDIFIIFCKTQQYNAYVTR